MTWYEIFNRAGYVLLIFLFGSTFMVLGAPLIGRMIAQLLARDRDQLRDAAREWNRERPDLRRD